MKSLAIACCLLLASCSTIDSQKAPAGAETEPGLVYYLPARSLLVTITTAATKVTGISAVSTASYPDRSRPYVLRHSTSALSKNVSDIAINNGLLTSTKAKATSGVEDAAKSLAGIAGAANAFRSAAPKAAAAGKCSTDGAHTFIYTFDTRVISTPCGVTLTVTPLVPPTSSQSLIMKLTEDKSPGIYYRQTQAYLVAGKTTGEEINYATVVLAPAPDPYFLPIARTFFAGNDAKITFSDGVLTGYGQDTDGEIVALLKLPASVLSAYFTAIGGVFDAFKSNDSKESAALGESIKLEIARKKAEACIAAAQSNDDELLKKLGCGT